MSTLAPPRPDHGGVRTHKPDCKCGMCAARRNKFGGRVHINSVLLVCNICGRERPQLCFPKLAAGGRGPTCRDCRPHGTTLDPIPVGVVT